MAKSRTPCRVVLASSGMFALWMADSTASLSSTGVLDRGSEGLVARESREFDRELKLRKTHLWSGAGRWDGGGRRGGSRSFSGVRGLTRTCLQSLNLSTHYRLPHLLHSRHEAAESRVVFLRHGWLNSFGWLVCARGLWTRCSLGLRRDEPVLEVFFGQLKEPLDSLVEFGGSLRHIPTLE